MLMLLGFLCDTFDVTLIVNALPFADGVRWLPVRLSLLNHVVIRLNASRLRLRIAARLPLWRTSRLLHLLRWLG